MLERRVQLRANLYYLTAVDPLYESLRDHPKFKAILREMKLAD